MDETRTTPVRFPPGRYGRRRNGRKPSKWLIGAAAVVAVAAGSAIAVKMYDQYGNPEYNGDVLTYKTNDRSVDITFEVYLPDGEGATCLLRARSEDGAEVGSAEVSIPAEDSDTTVSYTLETSAKPVTGELVRCYPARLDLSHTSVTLVVRDAPGHRGGEYTHFSSFVTNTSVRRMRSCPRTRTTPVPPGCPRRLTTG